MKRILLFLIVAIVGIKNTNAQCISEPFPMLHIYYQTSGVGIEGGMWPAEKGRFGIFGGMLFVTGTETYYNEILKTDLQRGYMDPIFYVRGQISLHRFVHITSALGLRDLSKPYTSAGLRMSFPIDRGKSATFLLEPQLTSMGYKVAAGIAVAFY
jgi:hypothetical protein